MSTHYTVRGGNSTAGLYCGSLLIHFAVSPGIYNWHVGAALSFKTSTHYTCRGGSSDGDSCGIFYIRIDLTDSYARWYFGVALLHGTHYPIRGGDSGSGVACGVFCCYVRFGAGVTGWNLGAALL